MFTGFAIRRLRLGSTNNLYGLVKLVKSLNCEWRAALLPALYPRPRRASSSISRGRYRVGLRTSLATSLRSRVRHHRLHVRKQCWRVVRDAILDGPLHAARAYDLPVTHVVDARGVEHLQILERIVVHHDQVGEEPSAHASKVGLSPQNARVVAGGVLNDLQRLKARLLLELEFSNEAETVHLINETRIVTHADQSALALEVAQR